MGRLTGIGSGSPNLLLYSLLNGDDNEPPPPPPPPPPAPAPCTGCEHYTGSLGGAGDLDYHPNGSYYYTGFTGYHRAWLRGPTNADFDLFLERYYGWWGWLPVAASYGTTSPGGGPITSRPSRLCARRLQWRGPHSSAASPRGRARARSDRLRGRHHRPSERPLRPRLRDHQVPLFLAHEDHDDPCDAIVRFHLRYDLRPLAEAYRDAYRIASDSARLLLDDRYELTPEGRLLYRF